MAPLRQFKGVPPEIIRKAEGKQFVSFLVNLCWNMALTSRLQPWYRYFDLVRFFRWII